MRRGWAFAGLLGCATAVPNGEDAGGRDAGEGEAPDARMFAADGAAPPDAPTPPPDAAPCVGGMAQVVAPEEGNCYLLFSDSQTWSSARASCEALVPSAHLVTIATADENALLAPYLGSADWFIGLSDGESEGVFRWSTGETLGYTNWRSGEPNNSGDEDCAVVEGRTGALWDDRPCGLAYLRVCERE